ncbi:hypothetical protein COCON_G00129840 [Conger conger]|uniref:SH2 domain-containing protein n=1 Tax=Conger conger TaxID=82655 RepID=A0A9Q1DDL1_CONCO|nr:hypothetical protein COCON_G00129840 [Conger conger]
MALQEGTAGHTCDFNMDFDYQQIKDSEMRLPAPQSEQPPARQIPPVKPRRSIKSRATPKEEAGPPGPPTNGREVEAKKEAVIQRVSPAVLRCGGPGPGPLEALSPSLRAHTLLWFERSQLPRLRRPGQPLPRWLHGFATRREAEELLKDEPEGCFLVRLSESKIGFVLSYRGRDRCRHFILEEEDRAPEGGRHYLIAGEESRHGSLQELINYYTQHPVGPFHEVLTVPCVKGKRGSEDLAGQGAGGQGEGRRGQNWSPPLSYLPP